VNDLPGRWPLAHAEAVRDELLAAYADPSRSYHDTRHLREVLDRLDELAGAGTPFDQLPVELAAWFHDAVYDGRPGADEQRSAEWAEAVLAAHEPPQVAEVVRLVRLTETHRPAPGDRNGCALTDADLAILAAAPTRYAEYAADVRREYAHVSDADFRAGRAAALSDLLAKPSLFHTDHARECWEAAARVNVEAELTRLA
jgi:predicted metal-dependent HD superfamily phosphohydrolase